MIGGEQHGAGGGYSLGVKAFNSPEIETERQADEPAHEGVEAKAGGVGAYVFEIRNVAAEVTRLTVRHFPRFRLKSAARISVFGFLSDLGIRFSDLKTPSVDLELILIGLRSTAHNTRGKYAPLH